MRRHGDYPIDEMIAAAAAAKSPLEAVFAALRLLDKAGGYVGLPINGRGGGNWRPGIAELKRRTMRRRRSQTAGKSQERGPP